MFDHVLTVCILLCFQYSSIEKDGEHYMSGTDFVQRYLGLLKEGDYNQDTLNLFANIVDTTKDG